MMQMLLICVLVAVAGSCWGQPIDCSEDEHCSSGYYCEPGLHICRECLHCEDLKRDIPKVATSCIKSVVECGSCFKGLVDDRRGDVSAGCVLPEAMDGQVLPMYVWVVIVIGLLVFAFVVIVLVYMLRNTDTFNIKAFTRTSVQSPCAGAAPPASAPPPPYNGLYAPVHPGSPSPPYSSNEQDSESSWPLVKRAPAPQPRPADARESAGSQEARVYNKPIYVRGPHLPPSYDAAPSDAPEQEGGFVPVDEDTMESTWTPDATNNNDASAGENAAASSSEAEAAGDSQAVALRRAPHADLAPPAKMLCLRQDTNKNRTREESSSGNGDGFAPAPAPAAGPSVVINVLNVNTVQQLSDITL